MIKKYIFYFIFIGQYTINNLFSVAIFKDISNTTSFEIFTLTPHTQLIIEKGDITKSHVQAIVNAANSRLCGGGGVCGAIFHAAGWNQLQNACNTVINPDSTNNDKHILCSTGQACITPSFNLKTQGIDWIIHAVGPIYNHNLNQDFLLASAYTNSLLLADKYDIQSIAFPFISSGIYGFPKQPAASIALGAIRDYCNKYPETSLTKIHFVLFSQEDFALFCKSAKSM